MTIININLHPISAKILKAEYAVNFQDREVIYIPSPDNHSSILSSSMHRSCDGLTVSLEVHCHVKHVPSHAGANLYHYHKRKCFEYILASIDAGQPARSALSAFYDIYGIEDDDYDMDSMYRVWTRFYSSLKNVSTYPTYSGERITFAKNNIKGRGRDIAALIMAEHIDLFYNKTGMFNKSMMKRLLTYTDVVIDGKKIRLHKNTKNWRLSEWRKLMHSNPSLHNTYRKLTGL